MSSAQINSLQAGRAFAALAVVFHHAALAAGAGSFPGYAILEAGYLGVDFFFVLSGFIIYHSTQGKDLRSYATARFRRVYLPYLPVGVGIALLYLAFPQFSAGNRSWSWLPTLTLLPVQAETALSVAWTLKHEILFYGVFAALYFGRLLAVGLAIWTAAIVGAAVVGFSSIPLSLLNLEFVFGILVAVAVSRGHGSRWWFLASAAALVIWLGLGAARPLSPIVGLAFAFAIIPIIRMEREGRFAVPTWLLLIGAASYALYLTHGVAISIVARMIDHPALILFVGISASLVAGLAYYALIEKPILRLAKSKRSVRDQSKHEAVPAGR